MKKENRETLRVCDLIRILKKMPQNSIVVADDGTGWLAGVRECDVFSEKCEDLAWVQIGASGEGI